MKFNTYITFHETLIEMGLIIIGADDMQELLPMHPPHVQCEEAGAAPGQGHEHRGHHVRGRS